MKDINAEIKVRVTEVCKTHQLTTYKIAKVANMSTSSVGEQVNRDAKVSIQVIYAILELCPDVSAEWMIRGYGSQTNISSHGEELLKSYKEQIAMQKEYIELLKEKISTIDYKCGIKKGVG